MSRRCFKGLALCAALLCIGLVIGLGIACDDAEASFRIHEDSFSISNAPGYVFRDGGLWPAGTISRAMGKFLSGRRSRLRLSSASRGNYKSFTVRTSLSFKPTIATSTTPIPRSLFGVF